MLMTMNDYRRSLSGIAVAIILFATVGCSNEVKLRRISGNVILDGKPIESGQIVITPIDQKSSAAAVGISNGTYSCPVMPGEKKVAIQSFSGGINDMGFPIGKQMLPPKYNDESELVIAVKNEDGQVFSFDLESN